MLKIISAPNPVLSQSAKQISKIDTKILKLIKEMEEALLAAKDPIGVGLAAPQVDRSLQIFIAKPTSKSPIQVFINPKVTANEKQLTTNKTSEVSSQKLAVGSHKSEATKLEGCLSLPNIWGEVWRDPKITLNYQLPTNNHQLITRTHTFSGFMATIIQHEMDHLDGILFPKRVLEQKGILYKSSKNEKDEDVFEEIEI